MLKNVYPIILIGILIILTSFHFIEIETGDVSSTDAISEPENYQIDQEKIINNAKELNSNYFIENKGQIPEQDHLYYSESGDVHFLPDGVLMRFGEIEPIFEDVIGEFSLEHIGEKVPDRYHEKGVVLRYTFVGANDVIPYGNERCSWNNNYFKGSDPEKWFTDVPNYKKIVYKEVWEGIDIVYRLKDGNVKYDIVIAPGSDPSDIQFQIDGCNKLSFNDNGDLVIGSNYGQIIDSGLIAYYEDNKHEKIVVNFKKVEKNVIGFDLDEFDNERVVVIDPLIYSTYMGGSSSDYGFSITTDSSGNAYIVGSTRSTNHPITNGAYDILSNGDEDIFITKLNLEGSGLVYSTYLGGSGWDDGSDIVTDSIGNAYITGFAVSTDFPTTSGAYDTSHNGGSDPFIAKLFTVSK